MHISAINYQSMIHLHTRVTRLTPENTIAFTDGQILSQFNRCGFFYCLTGKAVVTNYNNAFTICSGDVYIYLPSSATTIKSRTDDFSGYLCEADIDYILPIANRAINLGNIFAIRYNPHVSLTPEQAHSLTNRLEDLYRHSVNKCKDSKQSPTHFICLELYKALAQTIFYELMLSYFDNYKLTASVSQSKGEVVMQKFLVSLSQHYKEQREVRFYASEQNIAPRYFSQIIHKASGKKPMEWIVKMVLAEAKQQLEYSDQSVKEIAQNLNFCSQTFFGKYFKQYAGVSPSEYRQGLEG